MKKFLALYVSQMSAEEQMKTLTPDGVRQKLGLPAEAPVVIISAKIEEDLQELSPEEAKTFLTELGVDSSGLDRLIRTAYEALGYRAIGDFGLVLL